MGAGCVGESGNERTKDEASDSLDTAHGTEMIEGYLEDQVREIESAWPERVGDREQWVSQRPERVRQLREMLGLHPWPERSALQVTVTDTVEGSGYRVEKLHFQSMPGLYVTANLYVPEEIREPRPAILYVTGHATEEGPDGRPLGSKTAYQRHPAWYARHGYVALIIDTIQLGEIDGVHHGTYRRGRWWWYNRGYTPLGVEVWNGVRAIDLLQERSEVDADRIGVTGRSGGGAYSWFLGAVDERVSVSVPTAGITDLRDYVVDEVVAEHCDCMYMLNTYRWDFPMVAALSAPRPVRLVNGDHDPLFPIDGVRRVYRKARRAWRLYDRPERFDLVVEPAAHEDTPAIQGAAFGFMHRHLKATESGDAPVAENFSGAETPFDPVRLRVLDEIPDDAINPRIDETFVPLPDPPPVPEDPEEGTRLAEQWKNQLRAQTFRGWPDAARVPDPVPVHRVTSDGVALEAYRIQTQDSISLRLWTLGRAEEESAESVPEDGPPDFAMDDAGPRRLAVVDSLGWQRWVAALRAGFDDESTRRAIGPGSEAFPWPAPSAERFGRLHEQVTEGDTTLVVLAPRGVGPTRWTQDRPGFEIRRGFTLLGQTRDGMRVWDVLQALRTLSRHPPEASALRIEARGPMAGVALYASLFDESTHRLLLSDLPRTHREGPYLLNVRRILDLPQTVGLAALQGEAVRLLGAEESAWSWARRVTEQPWTEGAVRIRSDGDTRRGL